MALGFDQELLWKGKVEARPWSRHAGVQDWRGIILQLKVTRLPKLVERYLVMSRRWMEEEPDPSFPAEGLIPGAASIAKDGNGPGADGNHRVVHQSDISTTAVTKTTAIIVLRRIKSQ